MMRIKEIVVKEDIQVDIQGYLKSLKYFLSLSNFQFKGKN